MGQSLDVIEIDRVVGGGSRKSGDDSHGFVVALGRKLEPNFRKLLLLVVAVVVVLIRRGRMLLFDDVVSLFRVAEVRSDFAVMVRRRFDNDVVAELENDETGGGRRRRWNSGRR